MPQARAARRDTLRLHIATLALPVGFHREGERFAAVLRDELARLLANARPPSEPVRLETLGAGPVRFDARDRSDRAARRLAGAVAASLGRLR